jgi:chromosome segregation ATPase
LTDSGLEKWKQAAEEGDVRARTLLAEVERVAAEAHKQTFDEIHSAEERIASIQNKINEIATQIEMELAQAVNNAEEKALAMTDSGLKKWQQAAEEGDTKARALFVELEILSSETKKHTFDEIAAAMGQLDTIKNQITETASQAEAEMAKAVDNAEEKALGLTERGLEKWHSAIEEREAKAQALLEDLQAAMVNIENNMAVMEQRSAKIISDTEKKTLEDAQHQLESWKQVTSDEDAKIRQFLADLDAASAETKTRLVSENTAIEQRIKDLEIYAEGAMGAFKLQVEKRVKDAEQETIENVNTQVEKWKREASEKDAHIQQFLTDLETATVNKKQHISDEISAIEERLVPLEKRIDEATALVNQEMTNILSNVEKTALMLADEEREKWKQAVSEEDAKIRQLFADVEASFAGTRQHLLDEITEAEDRIGNLQHKIEETSSHIEDALVKAVGSAEEKALVLANTELEKWKQTAEAENSKIMELLSNVTHIFDDSEKKLADLKERLAVITQDAEQKLLKVTDEQVENWKDITAEAETNTRQLLADLEAAATEIKTHFTTENSALEQRLQEVQAYAEHLMGDLKTQVETIARNTEQKTLESMDGQLEKWKELVEGEDLKVRQIIADLEPYNPGLTRLLLPLRRSSLKLWNMQKKRL